MRHIFRELSAVRRKSDWLLKYSFGKESFKMRKTAPNGRFFLCPIETVKSFMFSLWIPLNGFRKIYSFAAQYTVAPVEIHSRFLRFFSSHGYNFALLFVISYNYERVVLSVIIILVVE